MTNLARFALSFTLLSTALVGSAHADDGDRRTMTCVGLRGAAGYSRLEAWCVSWPQRRAYHLVMHGAGVSFILTGTAFRITVQFPAGRYDQRFDPFPGEYFASVRGVAPGYSRLKGSAGNKTLTGNAINGGAGIDYTLAAHLRIEPASLANLPHLPWPLR